MTALSEYAPAVRSLSLVALVVIATDCWSGLSERTRSYPAASSSWKLSVPSYLLPISKLATVGSDPMKVGVITTWSPRTK